MVFLHKFAKGSAKRSWETLVLDLSPGLDTFSALELDLIYCIVRGANALLLAGSLDNTAQNC
jgi:hypothetical protein